MNRDLSICGCPNHLNIIGSSQAEDEINRHQAIAINAAMPLLNT